MMRGTSGNCHQIQSALLSTAAFVFVALPTTTLAQNVGQGIERRATPRPDLELQRPQYLEEEAPSIDLPPPPPQRSGASGQSIEISRIEVRGVTVFSQEEIKERLRPYEGKTLTSEEILAARDEITTLYIENGYINSGAIIPSQDIENGVLLLNVIEGRLTSVTANRDKNLRPEYVMSRMKLPADRPLNRSDLQEKFQFLLSDANIERIDARLSPGANLGEATLDLDVTAAPRYFMNLIAANDRSPSVGGNRGAIQGGVRNILGIGDLFTGEFGASSGLIDAAATYSAPLTANDLLLTLSGNFADAEVVEEPLNALDVISKSYGASAGLSMPVWRDYSSKDNSSLTQNVTLGLQVDFKRTETELLGQNFSFSPGAVDGVTEIFVGRAFQSYVRQSANQVVAVRSTVSIGLNALDPQVMLSITPPENFVVWLGQAQYARRLNDAGHQLSARLDSQIAVDTLFPTEKFAFGGQSSVRGYRVNQTLSDSGVVGSVEYSIPISSIFDGTGRGVFSNLRTSVFVDAGYGWNVGAAAEPRDDFLISAGVGVNWTPTDGVNVSASWAARFENPDDPPQRGPQDWGLGFRVTVSPMQLW